MALETSCCRDRFDDGGLFLIVGAFPLFCWTVKALQSGENSEADKTATIALGHFQPSPTNEKAPSTPPINTTSPYVQTVVNPDPANVEIHVSEVDIPKELESCFDILFGKGILEKIPVFPRQLNRGEAGFTKRNLNVSFASEEGKRDYLNEMTFPIMKAQCPDGSSVIIFKGKS